MLSPPAGLLAILLAIPVVAYATTGLAPSSSLLASYARPAALVAAVGGLLLVAGISLAGRLAARSQRWLLLLYVPGLYLTVAGCIGLTLAHAVLASAAMRFVLQLVDLGGTSSWILLPTLAPLAGAAFAVMAIVDAASTRSDPPQTTVVSGVAVDRAAAPALWQCVNDVAARVGAPVPDHIIVTAAMNFAALEPVVQVGEVRLEGRTLACSLPAGDILDLDEFRAVVAHELGHFHPRHLAFWQRYVAIFSRGRDVWNDLEPVPGTDSQSDLGGLVQAPARMVLAHFVASFAVAERALARESEVELDSFGGMATSPQIAATALAKVHVYAPVWQLVEVSGVVELIEGRTPAQARQFFARLADEFVTPQSLWEALDEPDAGAMASHPSLATRLSRLGVGAEGLVSSVRCVPPARPASVLFGDTSAFEDQLFCDHIRLQAADGAYAHTPVTAWSADPGVDTQGQG